jgi:hypothetical protein
MANQRRQQLISFQGAGEPIRKLGIGDPQHCLVSRYGSIEIVIHDSQVVQIQARKLRMQFRTKPAHQSITVNGLY